MPSDVTYEVEHVGLDVDFHHPHGRGLKLATETISAFEAQREHAEIFVQNSSGTGFSCDEILNWFLLQTRTTIADHLPAEARSKPGHHVMLTVPIRFEPGTFYMATEEGNVDLSALKLMCKVTITARNS